jgi:Zn-dependent protease
VSIKRFSGNRDDGVSYEDVSNTASDSASDSGRPLSLRRLSLERLSSPMNATETQFVEAIGMKPSRVLIRRPLTVAFERHFYLPGLLAATLTFVISSRHGFLGAAAAAAIAGVVFTLSLVAHEFGHLVLGRRARGITPRILLMRSAGGVAIVEGRYADARGAALFAAGGPLATLAVALGLVAGGLMLPVGPFATSLILPAALNLILLAVNLLPVAPTDGYLLIRSAFWASGDSRNDAERRAIRWSRRMLVFGFFISLLMLWGDPQLGMVALAVCASFVVQHRAAARRLTLAPPAH